MFSLPITAGIFLLSDKIVLMFSGELYYQSIKTLQILSFDIVLVGFAYITGLQILYNTAKEKIYLFSLIVGLAVLVISSIFLIQYQHNGIALSLVFAYVAQVGFQLLFSRNFFFKNALILGNIKYFIATFVMIISIIFTRQIYFGNLVIETFFNVLIGAIVYGIVLILLKDKMLIEILQFIKNSFGTRKMTSD